MGEMIKTSRAICKSCKYSMGISAFENGKQLIGCNYLCKTNKMRNCNIGECDKYKPRRKAKNEDKDAG